MPNAPEVIIIYVITTTVGLPVTGAVGQSTYINCIICCVLIYDVIIITSIYSQKYNIEREREREESRALEVWVDESVHIGWNKKKTVRDIFF